MATIHSSGVTVQVSIWILLLSRIQVFIGNISCHSQWTCWIKRPWWSSYRGCVYAKDIIFLSPSLSTCLRWEFNNIGNNWAEKVFLWWKMQISASLNEGVRKINMKKVSSYDKKILCGSVWFSDKGNLSITLWTYLFCFTPNWELEHKNKWRKLK